MLTVKVVSIYCVEIWQKLHFIYIWSGHINLNVSQLYILVTFPLSRDEIIFFVITVEQNFLIDIDQLLRILYTGNLSFIKLSFFFQLYTIFLRLFDSFFLIIFHSKFITFFRFIFVVIVITRLMLLLIIIIILTHVYL